MSSALECSVLQSGRQTRVHLYTRERERERPVFNTGGGGEGEMEEIRKRGWRAWCRGVWDVENRASELFSARPRLGHLMEDLIVIMRIVSYVSFVCSI